jgi:lipopolysaccharide/colanic/teichoic acid biosynthesis glycosyltransferase
VQSTALSEPTLTDSTVSPLRLADARSPSGLLVDIVFTENRRYQALRRLFDIVVASLLLGVCLPILLFAAVAIQLEDRGPVFFKQRRVGRFERLFTIYKLRTMRVDACADRLSPSGAGDPRVTTVGYWLRKTSIDELPQLLNVLRGEMTLVGPRPEMPFIVRQYAPWQHLRHLAVPGITGLWQVTYRSEIPLHRPEATLLDLQYIHSSSLLTNLALLVKTCRALVITRGAY